MSEKHKNTYFQSNPRSWAENDSNTFFHEKLKSNIYFEIADSQNGQNLTK